MCPGGIDSNIARDTPVLLKPVVKPLLRYLLQSPEEAINPLGLYLTMGAYDLVAISQFPDDEAAARFTLTLGAMGNVRTTTLKAFDEDSFRDIVSKLP